MCPCCRYIYAIYWAVTTICTVGYGDIVGVSVAEKVVAMVVMVFGESCASCSCTHIFPCRL